MLASGHHRLKRSVAASHIPKAFPRSIMDRKRRRIGDVDIIRHLAATRGVTQVALSELLGKLQDAPEELAASRSKVSLAVTTKFDELSFTVNLYLLDGSNFCFEMLDPSRLLTEVVKSCPDVALQYEESFRAHPPTASNPWDLIVGFDEFAPGNKLKVDNRRKVMVLSYTFRQLGQTAMATGRCWHTPLIIRSCMMHQVQGGWSAILALFLRRFLIGPQGLSTAGVVLDLPSGLRVLYGRLGNLLTDGDGWRLAYDWKGASSHRPCFRHWNVLRKGSDLAWRQPGYCEITCSDPSVLKPWPAGDVYTAVDVLAGASGRVSEGTMPRVAYGELETAYGLKFNRYGLFAALDLRLTPSIGPIGNP